MISLELKNAYKALDIDDKRNKLNDELLVIEELLKKIQTIHGLNPNFQIKNYESGSTVNDEEFLLFMYEDIFEIQKQLILIVDRIMTNKLDN